MAEAGPPSYPVTADGYDVYGEIGSGAFATVYHGRVRATGEEVAIKVIDLDLFNTDWMEIRREISTMSLLNHPNVVSIKCSFVDRQELWIIMPLLQAGSCAAIMKAIAPQGLKDEALIATILYFTLQDGRIHRDVKAGNILIGGGGEVQLADFGVAGTLMENGDRKKNRQTFTGTPCWMAPEVMEQAAGYDEKADVWSFGITALELAYGYAPYAKFQPMKVMLLTLQEDPPTADMYKDTSFTFSRHFHSLVEKCLRKTPGLRPSAKKLLAHRFFRGVKGKEYVQEQIVKKLPRPKRSVEVMGIVKKKVGVGGGGGGAGGGGGGLGGDEVGGVSVGSWVFDPNEFQEMKRAIALEEAKEGKAQRKVEKIEEGGDAEDDDEDYRTTPLHSPPLSPVLAPAGVLGGGGGEGVSGRKQSHGRFLVTDHVLEPQAPPAYPYGGGEGTGAVGMGVGVGGLGESVTSVYQAMVAGSGPTISHSKVGRFAVTDELHQ